MNKKINITNKKHHMRPKLIGIAVALVACLIGGTVVVGKYFNTNEESGTVNANMFYFTSDLLKEDFDVENDEPYKLPVGTTDVSITLSDYEDELRESDLDVKYYVEANGLTVTYADNEETHVIDKNNSSNNKVTLTGLEAGKKYTVTATGYTGSTTSDAGYHKTLKATFEVSQPLVYIDVRKDPTKDPDGKENEEYILLTVWSEGYEGDVDINYSKIAEKVMPDKTDSIMGTVTIQNNSFTDEYSFKNTAYNSHTYRFFYKNKEAETSGISENDFSVTYNNGTTAQKGTLYND
jgi:hypothetical protein